MPYTRIYPMSVAESYDPANNPLIIDVRLGADVTGGLDTLTLTGVSQEIVDLADGTTTSPFVSTEWYIVIYAGSNSEVIGTYNNIGTTGNPGELTATRVDASIISNDSYSATNVSIRFFNVNTPNEWDAVPEGFIFETVPSGAWEYVTADGAYVITDGSTLVPGAIYSISIREIITLNSGVGFLLGSSGFNGTALIPTI